MGRNRVPPAASLTPNPMNACSLLVWGVALVCSARAVAAETQPPVTIAFLPCAAVETPVRELADSFVLQVAANLALQPDVWLVERADLEAVLGEQALGASGMADPASAAAIGRVTGAQILVLSRATGRPSDTTVSLRIVSASNGRVFPQSVRLREGADAPADVARTVAAAVHQYLQVRRAEFVVAATDADPGPAVVAAVAGRPLPTVSVRIPEAHVGVLVIDPAAETEIARLLLASGARLLDPAAEETPQFRVVGEAFSERGVRRGEFVSCRARVEVRVIEVATGRIILQDRENTVAVDLGEFVAGKSALQRAGGILAARIAGALAEANAAGGT